MAIFVYVQQAVSTTGQAAWLRNMPHVRSDTFYFWQPLCARILRSWYRTIMVVEVGLRLGLVFRLGRF